MGRASTCRPSRRRKRSGDELATTKLAEVEKRRERRGIAGPEPAVQLERRAHKRGFEPLRQVGLKDVPGADVLDHLRHGVLVAGAGERRAEPETGGVGDVWDGIGRGGGAGGRVGGWAGFAFAARLPACPPARQPFLHERHAAQRALAPSRSRSGIPVDTSQARFVRWSQAITQS